MSDATSEAVREVTVPNAEGLHMRPAAKFVDLAAQFHSTITVANLSGRKEAVDGKSALQVVLLEATKGSVLRIEAQGDDATEAADALASLVEAGFRTETSSQTE